MTDISCKTCRFHDRVNGECHRYPPIPVKFSSVEVSAALPQTKDLDWCGEHVERIIVSKAQVWGRP